MSLIKKAEELTIPTTIKMMIYGQAGVGKTTLALSAPAPLLLDFDGGVNRLNAAHVEGVDTVQVQSWNDIKQLLTQEVSALAPYQSIVVDTVGKMMDYIITFKCGTNQPSIRDWGGINQEFTWFTRALSSLGKHLVFVAHRDTRKEGDNTVFVPSLREKSYNTIVTDLDLLGYVVMKDNKGVITRTITFNPTPVSDGKNTVNLPGNLAIPVILDEYGRPKMPNNFLQRMVIDPYNVIVAQKMEKVKAYEEVMSKIKEDIDALKDAKSATAFVGSIDSYSHVGNSKVQAGVLLNLKVKSLGLKWDKESKSYKKEK